MKKLDSYENTNVYGDFETLPAGGHKCIIKKVECQTSSNGKEFLKISFDIAEGKYKDFYKNKYLNDQRADKKWSGIWVLFTEGYEKDSTNPKFKGLTTSVEESNTNYKWDWDEKTLENKKVGIVFRAEEFEAMDGSIKTSTKPFYAMSYDKVEEAKIPKEKVLPEKGDSFEDSSISDDSEDLPF